MKFSIIVTVLSTAECLRRCIAARERLDYPRNEYDIPFVDNDSTKRASDILLAASHVQGAVRATVTGRRTSATRTTWLYIDPPCNGTDPSSSAPEVPTPSSCSEWQMSSDARGHGPR